MKMLVKKRCDLRYSSLSSRRLSRQCRFWRPKIHVMIVNETGHNVAVYYHSEKEPYYQ